MDTVYNIDDTVYIEAKVKEIYVDKEGIKYVCIFESAYGDICRPTVKPEIVKKHIPHTRVIKEDSSNAET